MFTKRNHKTNCIFEEGALDKNSHLLSNLGERVLIVTGKNGAARSGALADALSVLQSDDIAFRIFDGISANPTLSSVREGAKAGLEFGAEGVLAIGGGSVMDAAKAIAYLMGQGDADLPDQKLFAAGHEDACLPLMVVGTTAGTGSEVTNISVLTKSDGRKQSISADCLFPKVAFSDPLYTNALGRTQTISTGLDALCHLLESYFSENFQEAAENDCLEGIALAAKQLSRLREIPDAYKTAEFRRKMLKASLLGGYAIDLCRTAFPHLAGYVLTEEANLPHGLATAVFLPDFLMLAAEEMPEREEKLLAATGFDCQSLSALSDELVQCLLFEGAYTDLHCEMFDAHLARFEASPNRLRTPSSPDAEELIALAAERLALLLAS